MFKKISTVFMVFCMIFCFTACGSSSFEDKGDYISGNKWEGTDGSLIELNSDGTHKFYKNSGDLSDNYYKGDYTVLNGQQAIDYLSNEHGLPEDAQRQIMSQYGVEDKYYYVLTLNNKECIVEGKNTLGEASKLDYFGYYSPTDQHLNFKSLKTMVQMDFYKK